MQLFFAAPILAASLIVFSSFASPDKNITNGGGIAGDVHFNYTAVQAKDGSYVGHFSWGSDDYSILCVVKSGNTATIYLSDGMAVNVVDSKDGDQITAPYAYTTLACVDAGDVHTFLSVSGNLTVHK